MISTWLTEKKIQIVDSVSDWKQAITISAQPLLVDESINENYVEEQGAKKNGLSLLHIKEGVSFDADENDPIFVVIMLCAVSGDEHIRMITALAEIFCDEARLDGLLKASTKEKINNIING